MKTGLVLEGGGLRGIFSAGVLDVLMEEGIEFDGGIGVSAGAAFGCNYKSKQPRRAIRYNMQFAKDPRYSSLRSLLATGDLFNAQFCYHDIPEKLFPFDWEAFRENPMKFYLVCTDVETGEPVYHLCNENDGEWEMLEWFRASGSMPLVSRIVEIGGRKLLDGGISDSIPLRFMEEQGYERNLVILTRPENYVKRPNPMMPMVRRAFRSYPATIQAMEDRHTLYNETLAYIRSREAGKYAFVIRPETDLDIGRIEHDRIKIREAYKEGRRIARRRLPGIRRFLRSAKAGAFPAEGEEFTAGQSDSSGNAGNAGVMSPVRPSLVEDNPHHFNGPVKPSLVEDPAFSGPAAETGAAAEHAEKDHTIAPSALEIEPSASETFIITDNAAGKETGESSVTEDPPFVRPVYLRSAFNEPVEEDVKPAEQEPAEQETAPACGETAEEEPAAVTGQAEEQQAEAETGQAEEQQAAEAAGQAKEQQAAAVTAEYETEVSLDTINPALVLRNARRNKGRGQKKTWRPGEITILKQQEEDD